MVSFFRQQTGYTVYMTLRADIISYCDEMLAADRFRDYCPNGLQVEGATEVVKIISGVTACRALIEAAVEEAADTLLVHHGYFWKGEEPRIVGMKRERIRLLLDNNINLLAYHLPLDAHPEFGNNAQLAAQLGLQHEGGFAGNGGPDIAMFGRLASAMTGTDFADHIARVLGRAPLYIDGSDGPVQRVAWCTGAAQGYIEEAASLGVDTFITGEVSEHTVHVARELGLHFYAAGHHATERYGVQALGEHLAGKFTVEHTFIDIDNPA
jgi:dinuclear metal center YbgI/SA1388 family protein